MPGPDPRKARLMQGPSQDKKSGRPGLGLLGKKLPKEKEAEVMIMQMIEGRQHPDSIKLKKMKKFTNSDGNIEFKAKGGRAGYKDGSKGCKLATKGKGNAYGKNS